MGSIIPNPFVIALNRVHKEQFTSASLNPASSSSSYSPSHRCHCSSSRCTCNQPVTVELLASGQEEGKTRRSAKMSQMSNQNNDKNVSTKRAKRGRPRKNPKPEEERCGHIAHNNPIPKSSNHLDPPVLPPGYEVVGFPKHSKEQQGNYPNQVKVGHVVHALIEGEFDGGYWLSIGNGTSNSPLRGMIFKPECPIFAKQGNNNVAGGTPLVPMNIAPSFQVPSNQVQNPLTNARNEAQNVIIINRNEAVKRTESPSLKEMVTRKDPTPNPLTIGNVLPAMMNPVTPPNVMNQAFLENMKSMSQDIPTINIPSAMKSFLADGNQTLPASASPNQTSLSMLSRGKQVENVEHYQSSIKEVLTEEAMRLRELRMPFDFNMMVDAVVNKVMNRLDSKGLDNGINNSGGKTVKETKNDMDGPMPLQMVQGYPPLQPHFASSSSRPFKMTDFIQGKGNGEPGCHSRRA